MREEQAINFDANPPITSSDYDRIARMALPGYEAMHTMVLSILKYYFPATANFLIVGAGTGMELLQYAQSNPLWQMLGVDPSEKMLAIAQTKIEEYQLCERVKLVQSYTDDLPPVPLYDAATSILVMHFIPDDGGKLAYLQSIVKRLKPSATFVLVDVFGDKSSPEFERIAAYIQIYWEEMGLSVEKRQEIFAAVDKGVYLISETRVFELLQQAGFTNITRFYTGLWVGGWVASKMP
jgi:tRNA (cmo5U34)-methyltransferase